MTRRRSWWGWGALALATFALGGCLGEGGYLSIGRQGGKVAAEGAVLSIASEVLSSPLQFRISRLDPARLPAGAEPPGQIIQSDPFYFQTRGGEGMPATVSIPLKTAVSGETSLEVYQLYQGEWVWLTAASAHPEGSAVAPIPVLPAIVVVVSPPPSPPQVSLRWSAPTPPAEGALRAATSVHLLGYGVAADGSLFGGAGLLPPGGYRVIPVVQNGGPGGFDGAPVAAILSDDERRQRHLDGLVALAERGDYAGLELDYRGLDLSLRDALTAFVSELAETLHQQGRLLYLDVPLPQRRDGGWDDGAYDWRGLGAVVDALVLYPPKDLSFYSARMGEVMRYGITQVERRKLRLGINTSSHEKLGEAIQDISRSQALERAAQIQVEGSPPLISGEDISLVAPFLTSSREGAPGKWDRLSFSQEANTLAFSYGVGERRRRVWIENAQSLTYKLQLALRYRLGGVNLEGDFGAVDDGRLWQVLGTYRQQGQVEPPGESEMPVPLWQSSDGSLRARGQARVSWRLPAPGGYVVTLCLSDGAAQGCQQLSLTVVAPPSPTATPRLTATPTPTPTATPGPGSPIFPAPAPVLGPRP